METKIANSTVVSFKCPSNLLSGELRMQSVLLHINYEHFTTYGAQTSKQMQTHTNTVFTLYCKNRKDFSFAQNYDNNLCINFVCFLLLDTLFGLFLQGLSVCLCAHLNLYGISLWLFWCVCFCLSLFGRIFIPLRDKWWFKILKAFYFNWFQIII